jgi:hypothetical protein
MMMIATVSFPLIGKNLLKINDKFSVCVCRDLERERIEGELRRERDARRNEQERIHYEKYSQITINYFF